MMFLLDLLLIIIVVTTIVRCTVRGFVKSVINLVSLGVSFLVARLFTPQFGDWLETKFFAERITNSVKEVIRSLAAKGAEVFDLSRLFANMPADFSAMLSRYGADVDALTSSYGGISEAGEATAAELAATIAAPVISGVSNVCAFILLFLGSMLICGLVGLLLNLLVKLPGLRTANRLLGLVLGVVIALILTFLYANAASMLMGYLATVDPGTFAADIMDKTLIVKYFCLS